MKLSLKIFLVILFVGSSNSQLMAMEGQQQSRTASNYSDVLNLLINIDHYIGETTQEGRPIILTGLEEFTKLNNALLKDFSDKRIQTMFCNDIIKLQNSTETIIDMLKDERLNIVKLIPVTNTIFDSLSSFMAGLKYQSKEFPFIENHLIEYYVFFGNFTAQTGKIRSLSTMFSKSISSRAQ